MPDPQPLLSNDAPPKDWHYALTSWGWRGSSWTDRVGLTGSSWRDWVEPEAARLADEEQAKGKKIRNAACSGPALAAIWWTTPVQWGFALGFPLVVAWRAECPPEDQPFAHYGLWAPAVYLIPVGFALYREYRALKWALPTIAAYCSPFTFLGTKTFTSWFILMFMVSLASHADLATNGLFLAKILKTQRCAGHNTMWQEAAKIWHHTIGDAKCVAWIPYFDRLDCIVIFGVGAMLLQPLYGFMYAQPVFGSWRNVDYGVNAWTGYKTLWALIFKTGQGGTAEIHHADVLQGVATVNRMAVITEKSTVWTLKRSEEELVANTVPSEGYPRAFNMIDREFARMATRIWLFNLLEKAYMIEVQVTVFAISRCLQPKDLPWIMRLDGQMLVSIILSFLTFGKTVVESYVHLRNMTGFMMKKVPEEVDNEAKAKVRWSKFRLCVIWGLYFIALFMLSFALLHALTKFVMAGACKDSLWNLPLGGNSGDDWNGCVRNLEQYTHPARHHMRNMTGRR
uniref:Uncharacterized protein n=1 Tax=Alexandrium catenella TaxID=2925 RepID=A0A7S1QKI3_ALECA|mmetsp:Transcript_34055/g.92196  ORF Transcript_34055/g.92196 Transcript_34055/m.92196 type:complete len:511 (+) Transcript_34055:75-1607(+)